LPKKFICLKSGPHRPLPDQTSPGDPRSPPIAKDYEFYDLSSYFSRTRYVVHRCFYLSLVDITDLLIRCHHISIVFVERYVCWGTIIATQKFIVHAIAKRLFAAAKL